MKPTLKKISRYTFVALCFLLNWQKAQSQYTLTSARDGQLGFTNQWDITKCLPDTLTISMDFIDNYTVGFDPNLNGLFSAQVNGKNITIIDLGSFASVGQFNPNQFITILDSDGHVRVHIIPSIRQTSINEAQLDTAQNFIKGDSIIICEKKWPPANLRYSAVNEAKGYWEIATDVYHGTYYLNNEYKGQIFEELNFQEGDTFHSATAGFHTYLQGFVCNEVHVAAQTFKEYYVTYDNSPSCKIDTATCNNYFDIYVSSDLIRQGRKSKVWTTVKNGGGTELKGNLHLELDDQILTNNIDWDTPPDSLSGNTAIWNDITVGPFAKNVFSGLYLMSTTIPIGSFVSFRAYFEKKISTELCQAADTSTHFEEVIGSYDPNDKMVTYLGPNLNDNTHDTTQFEYRIRFQNTGNDTAFMVVIKDPISSHLDINSVEMLDASHNYTLSTKTDSLVWTFNNILLVDSNKNEPLSHGFIRFRIKQKSQNSVGTKISNKAYIYFDYNTAVITNEVVSTISDDLANVTNMNTKINTNSISCHPNPTDGIVNFNDFVNVNVLAIDGKILLSENNVDHIDIRNLPNSLYYLSIQYRNHLNVIRIVKM